MWRPLALTLTSRSPLAAAAPAGGQKRVQLLWSTDDSSHQLVAWSAPQWTRTRPTVVVAPRSTASHCVPPAAEIQSLASSPSTALVADEPAAVDETSEIGRPSARSGGAVG